jgi:hypothetical protein
MPLPGAIATKVVSLGKYYAADGTLLTGWTANVVVSQDLRYAATGDVILQVAEPVTISADGTGLVRLPVSDQAGFVSSNNAPASGWSYTIAFGGSLSSKRPKIFQLPGSAPDPFDADNVADGSSVPPSSPITTYVNGIIINGTTYTGTPDLTSALGTGVTGSTTVGGITDATPIGQGLLRSADTNGALTVLGINALPGQVAALQASTQSALAAMQSTINAQASTIAALQTSKLDATTVGVTVAGLDGNRKLPLANLTSGVTVDNVAVSGTYPLRQATPNRVIWYGPTRPTAGGTIAGGGGAVDNYDRWVVTAS